MWDNNILCYWENKKNLILINVKIPRYLSQFVAALQILLLQFPCIYAQRRVFVFSSCTVRFISICSISSKLPYVVYITISIQTLRLHGIDYSELCAFRKSELLKQNTASILILLLFVSFICYMVEHHKNCEQFVSNM